MTITPIATGRRTALVTFKTPAEARTNTGDLTRTYTATLATRWAEVQTITVKERESAGQVVGEATYKATFPYLSGLTLEHRATIGSTNYGIEGLDDRQFAGVEHIAYLKETT